MMSRVINTMKPICKRRSELMSKSLKIAVILTGVLVAGCASFQRDHFTVGSVTKDYRTQHPIVVSQSEVSEDLIVSRSMKGISLRQQNFDRKSRWNGRWKAHVIFARTGNQKSRRSSENRRGSQSASEKFWNLE